MVIRFLFLIFKSSASFPNISFFFFNDTATTEIYTLSLHDALPIWSSPTIYMPTTRSSMEMRLVCCGTTTNFSQARVHQDRKSTRLKLQSPCNLVCRLLLEKKKRWEMRPISWRGAKAGHLNRSACNH